ncbi:MAG: tRNA (N(6)-L-threonylcarbamoyladenosine(37)-C(2))-methylthiotransferase MtaB [Clostridia bacterium]|nr:tRNA (N(6)-L-threonylcarbamoyladenosine(37)-C(2))-methylthiotransferase MtaB [Clostridia bacterium]
MPYTVSILTLGCRVNQYESDSFAEDLAKAGITVVPFGEPCDLAVVNTCTVTAESDRKSRQMIRRAARDAKKVAVTGCFAQISPDEACALPNVVFVRGNGGKASLTQIIPQLLADEYGDSVNGVLPPNDRSAVEMTVVTPMRTRSYVKIEDGCNNRCSYCIISTARGPVRSKDPAVVLEEIRVLAENGCREVILTGIETAAYGLDFAEHQPYGYALADLIAQVGEIDGIERIGLGSLDPTVLTPHFLEIVSKVPKLLPHFHLSVQSGCSRILAKMRRKYNRGMALAAISRLKAAVPDVTLSADVIVGFPGETEEDFADTMAFFEETRFLHLHIFPYSKRAGTEAAVMPGQVPENVKKDRLSRLESLSREIKNQLLDEYVRQHRENPVYLLVEKYENEVTGHSEHFIETVVCDTTAHHREIVPVLLDHHDGEKVYGKRA